MGCLFCQPVGDTDLYIGPTQQSITVQRGMVVEFDAVLTDAFLDPIDITLDTVTLTVWDFNGGTKKIQKINSPGGHVFPSQGRTRFTINPADITEADNDRQLAWHFEVRRTTPAPKEFIHISGDFIVQPELGT